MFKEIGRYQIVEELGQGSMATVYKAYDPRIDRQLAIKVLKDDKGTDTEYHHRFLQEAKAAGVLSHPNIVTVYDIGEIDNHPYIVIELVEGTPLDELMKSHIKLTLPEIVTIGIQLANALDYAHSQGIIHRDVKPANILCLKNSNTIKLTDFGIARIESADTTHQTLAGEVLGTPQYMSPEQVMGKKVDSRSDLFAVGVIMYQLITGLKPFDADSLATLLFKIATDNPKPIAQVTNDLPPQLAKIIDKLLSKNPDKRIQSGKELAHALSKIQNHLKGKPEQATQRWSMPLALKWPLVMALCVTIPLLAGAYFISSKQQDFVLEQTLKQGVSIARLIAIQNAIPLLGEEWLQIDTFIQETAKRENLNYLFVLDYRDIIKGSNKPQLLDQPFNKLVDSEKIAEIKEITVRSDNTVDGNKVYDFSAPILFNNKEIGRVHLGLPQASLLTGTAGRFSWILILLVVFIIIISTLLALYFAKQLSSSAKKLHDAFDQISTGQLNSLATNHRNDEIGILYKAFNEMVGSLRKRLRSQKATPD